MNKPTKTPAQDHPSLDIFRLTTPSGSRVLQAAASRELALLLRPHLELDERTAQSVGYVAFALQGNIRTPHWSLLRLGSYTFTPAPDPLGFPLQKGAASPGQGRSSKRQKAVQSSPKVKQEAELDLTPEAELDAEQGG